MCAQDLRKTNPNAGHREGLRRRFHEHSLENFQGKKALELLLLFVARQQDMRPVAQRLIDIFGSFRSVLDDPTEELVNVQGAGEGVITLIHVVNQAATRYFDHIKLAPLHLRTHENSLMNVGSKWHFYLMSNSD